MSSQKDTVEIAALADGRSVALDLRPSDKDPASFLQGWGGVERRVPRWESGTRLKKRRLLPVEASPVSEAVFPRFSPGGIAHSDRREDLPGVLNYAHRCAVDEDLAGGNVDALDVRRVPEGDARDPDRNDHGGRNDCFHRVTSGFSFLMQVWREEIPCQEPEDWIMACGRFRIGTS
jgi:hypothetical protein